MRAFRQRPVKDEIRILIFLATPGTRDTVLLSVFIRTFARLGRLLRTPNENDRDNIITINNTSTGLVYSTECGGTIEQPTERVEKNYGQCRNVITGRPIGGVFGVLFSFVRLRANKNVEYY